MIMKISKNKKIIVLYRGKDVARHVSTLLAIIVFATLSCTRIYDNIEKFVDGETIYAERLDGIIRVQVGYERVEIDLLKAGRIPSSQIRTVKAAKTVIECPDFTEPDHRRVIDSVCSWVNVTGLTQLKNYRLTIYTEDNFGNRSMPFTTDVRPYTADNFNMLELQPPRVTGSSSAALVEWRQRLSGNTYTMYRYRWEYRDRDGALHTGGGKGDMPNVFVQNVNRATDIPITFTSRIVPNLSNFNGTYTAILDSVDWQTTYTFRIPENADAIFLLAPAVDNQLKIGDSPTTFSWTKADLAGGYTLKISDNPAFQGNVYTVVVGDVDEYVMTEEEGNAVFNQFNDKTRRSIYLHWTITPTVENASNATFTRRMIAVLPGSRSLQARCAAIGGCVGLWEFNDVANLEKATIGKKLTGYNTRTIHTLGTPSLQEITPVAGFDVIDGAVNILTARNHFLCDHGIPPNTDNGLVGEYTLLYDVSVPSADTYPFLNTHPANGTGAAINLNSNGMFNGFTGGNAVALRTWYCVAITLKAPDELRAYINGAMSSHSGAANDVYKLKPEGFLFFGQGSVEFNITGRRLQISSLAVFNKALTAEEVQSLGGL